MTIQEQPVVDSTPTTEVAETPEPAASIADHASQFSPDRQEADETEIPKTPANTGQFANKPPDARHKAQSQRATPEDVAEINRLTRELRETEARIGDKDPDAKVSPRVRTLKRQLAALRALEQPAPNHLPPPSTTSPDSGVSGTKPAAKMVTDTGDKEPDIEDFANEPDPIKAWMIAHNRWDRKQERLEEARQQAEVAQRQAQEEIDRTAWNHIESFAQTTPDYWQVTQAFAQRDLPANLYHAIKTSDNAGRVVYYLSQHPELADELVLLTDGKPFSDASVAVVQRRLSAALGQAAQVPDRPPVTPPYSPPRPPNPVRTGPIKTADDPPGEAPSIRDHAKYYGIKR